MNRFATLLVLALFLAVQTLVGAQTAPTQPTQPESGPGGSEYRYTSVESRHLGTSPTGSWIFYPERADTDPLPVIIFLHGFSAVDTDTYLAWLEHLVKRGAIVIFPDYQTGNPIEINPAEFQDNAIEGIQVAIAELESGSIGPHDLERTAMLGHSLGGILTLNLAAISESAGLPVPDLIMPVEPGGCSECGGLSSIIGQPFEDLSQINPSTRALIIVGDADDIVGDTAAQIAWGRMEQIPLDQRDYVIINSDPTGDPQLVADHYAPETGGPNGETDALDWFGFWKLFDLLADCTFYDLNCDQALGGTPEQLFMGTWSDGTAVISPTITKSP